MKRSPGSPTFGGGPQKRFETMRSSPQMQLQQQYHQQIHQLHHQQQNQQHHQQQHPQQHQQLQQQYQHNAAVAAAMAANAPFFPNLNTPPPGMQNMNSINGMNSMNCMNSMMSYQSPNSAPNPYIYNANPSMQTRMWKYHLPPTAGTPPSGYDVNTQPPLPLVPPQQPPPLPPTQPPPLPPSEQEPPTFVANMYIPGSSASTTEYEDVHIVNNKKMKRKSISNRSCGSKPWDREDALKAIALEKEYANKTKSKILLLRFPDPELSREIVSRYSPQIKSVHFQQNSAPRFCFVRLNEDADIDKETEIISKIPFGNGFIKVELKRSQFVDTPHITNPEEIDPYTLYIGNLPTTISSRTVKEHFPGAQRIDIGHALRMKYTRYAFVRYHTVEESIAAFRKCINTLIESRSPIVRFRRFPSNEQKTQRKEVASVAPSAAAAINFDSVHAPQAVQEVLKMRGTDETPAAEISVSAPIPETRIATTKHDSQLEASLSASTAFDSPPNSLEESEPVQILPASNCKDKVPIEAEQLNRKKPTTEVVATNVPQRRSSIEVMLEEFDHRRHEPENIATSAKTSTGLSLKTEMEYFDEPSEDEEPLFLPRTRHKASELQVKTDPDSSSSVEELIANASPSALKTHKSSGKTTIGLSIKKETEDFDEPSEDEEPMSLLGTRYKEDESQIKTDPDASPTGEEANMAADDLYQDDFVFDDECDSEPEETIANAWPGPSTLQAHKSSDVSRAATSQNPNWEIVQKKELEDVDEKPTLEELSFAGPNKTNNLLPFPFPIHTSDIEKLHEQRRQIRRRERRERPHDDLDDMFAQMNSDSEDDDDYF